MKLCWTTRILSLLRTLSVACTLEAVSHLFPMDICTVKIYSNEFLSSVHHIPILNQFSDRDNPAAFRICVPLYRVADFLGFESMCCKLLDSLFHFVKMRARHIQASCTASINSQPWHPTDDFTTTFAEYAKLAYSIPDQRIRQPFVRFLVLTRPCSTTVSREFLQALQGIPELLVDTLVDLGSVDGGAHSGVELYLAMFGHDCIDCREKALSNGGNNLWMGFQKCFKCWAENHNK